MTTSLLLLVWTQWQIYHLQLNESGDPPPVWRNWDSAVEEIVEEIVVELSEKLAKKGNVWLIVTSHERSREKKTHKKKNKQTAAVKKRSHNNKEHENKTF